MTTEITDQVRSIITSYIPSDPYITADRLRNLWLQFEPKSTGGIKAELQTHQETVGISVAVLKFIGQELGKIARKQVDDFIPLVRLLWDEYGREGRIVAIHPLGMMELVQPETIMPLTMSLCRTCITWEDADQLAMNALEPIVRRKPEQWLAAIEPWLGDENKWVRRAGVTVAGRLAMKHATYTERCLEMTERLLFDEEVDVKRAVSFAIRLCARGDVALVRDLLARHVPPDDPRATWVLCDAIRSMAKKLLPEFVSLLPHYEQWAADTPPGSKDHRSVDSAVALLRSLSH